jgi:catechol 2,3-dioxygenase-like lactoylglutathione lyase family enzyme
MARKSDDRPPVAVGHIRLQVNDVAPATAFFENIGMRRIVRQSNFAVLELRGGTHLVLSATSKKIRAGTAAPFDLMVDDVEAAHAEFAAKGLEPGTVKSGSIHSSFYLPGPDGYKLKITSSHAGGRPV